MATSTPTPTGPAIYVGWCNPSHPKYRPEYVCNDKLIGAWDYADASWAGTAFAESDGPGDNNGHGSHTAATAAGNVVDAALYAPTASVSARISGVAPRANLIAYDVCAAACRFSDSVAALEQALIDGVDVINESIGISDDAWNGVKQQAYLGLFNAGVVVVRSAGNNGPGAGTVESSPPWVIDVAATTHNRLFTNGLTGLEANGGALDDLAGVGFTGAYGPAPILYAGALGDYDGDGRDDSNALCGLGAAQAFQSPWPAGFFQGEIIVCDRGVYGRVEKGANLAAAGAGGYVLINTAEQGETVTGDAHLLPGLHLGAAAGAELRQWLQTNSNTVARIAGAQPAYSPAYADHAAAFSARGPALTPGILKPDIGAPGVDIWAALAAGAPATPEGQPPYGFMSGTSMASPHVAGAAALLRALHPTWSPAEIKSALLTTAVTAVLKEDGVTPADPHAVGAGRLDLTAAARAGLLLNESGANFAAANPLASGAPQTLNLPALVDGACVNACRWTRTVRSALDRSAVWTAVLELPDGFTGSVTPATFTLAPGATQELTITLEVEAAGGQAWRFGALRLTPDLAAVPAQQVPIAVLGQQAELPERVVIPARRDAGSQLVTGLRAPAITNFTVEAFGLTPAAVSRFALPQDPTNATADGGLYDDLDQVFWMTFDVPPGTLRLAAEVVASAAPDVDMALGFDSNGDGRPSPDEERCLGAGGYWNERCDLFRPRAGTWWVVVMNYAASAPGAVDAIELATAVVPAQDAGNLRVEGPTAVPAMQPFDVRIFFDQVMQPGDYWYGAVSLGTDPGQPGNIGLLPIDLRRLADDVTKSASSAAAMPGDRLTFTIAVQPNMLLEDLAYTIEDVLPDGYVYVPGSATATSGAVRVEGNRALRWTGVLPGQATLGAPTYRMTTSRDDPACDTGFGGYVNLEDYGVMTNPVVRGNGVAFRFFTSGDPITFFGDTAYSMTITDDGLAIFNPTRNMAGALWIAQTLPDPARPNSLAAMLWQDMEIVYDAAANRGVSAATADGGLMVVEYDGVQLVGDPDSRYDFQIVMRGAVDDAPGAYEIVFAYDNLNGPLAGPLTIGLEDAAGETAVPFVNAASAQDLLTNGLMICFDAVQPEHEPVVITYQATVAPGALGIITNTAVHATDNPGSRAANATAVVRVGHPTYLPAIRKN
jgi:uncharacterized repeat protein (TIGR01451 family)